MRTVTFQSVIEGALEAVGIDPSVTVPSSTLLSLGNHLNRLIPDAWVWTDWPELTDVVSLAPEVDNTVTLDFAPALISGIYKDDPRANKRPATVDFTFVGEVVTLFGCNVPSPVYVLHWLTPSQYTRRAYDATLTYKSGDVRYFEGTGECYQALAAVAAGETPLSNPEKWLLQPMPQVLADYAVLSGAAFLAGQDGQTIQKNDFEADASDALLTEQDNFRMRTNAHLIR